MKVTLHDTFNGYTISRHRSLEAAVKAERKFLRDVERANGAGSYIPTEIRIDGSPLTDDEREQVYVINTRLDCGI